MATYLITWKPTRWSWDYLQGDIAQLRSKGTVDGRWSCGRNKSIRPNDRLFLLRQGAVRPGIIASGWALSAPFEAPHFDSSRAGDTALYIDVRFDTLLDPDSQSILQKAQLSVGPVASVHWNTQASGITIAPEAAAQLESMWSAFLATLGEEPVISPEEVAAAETYFEGATRRVSVSIYERSGYARRRCVEHYGSWVRCLWDGLQTGIWRARTRLHPRSSCCADLQYPSGLPARSDQRSSAGVPQLPRNAASRRQGFIH